MGPVDLRADCSKCAALCCVGLAFDRSALFAFDKQAGEACRHLAGRTCAIHSQRTAQGMAGCIRYDCLGAGQRATELCTSLAPTRSGAEQRSEAQRSWLGLLDAFALFRDLHQLLWLLQSCREGLALSETQRSELERLEALLLEIEGEQALERFARSGLTARVHGFVATLRGASCSPVTTRRPDPQD